VRAAVNCQAFRKTGKNIIGYREAMTLAKQPKRLVVVGSGAIGVEFAYFYNAIGTEVTVVEVPEPHCPCRRMLT
jgi:dihydrolipoamide dehydrogenase